jgi:hypothetical protein
MKDRWPMNFTIFCPLLKSSSVTLRFGNSCGAVSQRSESDGRVLDDCQQVRRVGRSPPGRLLK